MCHTYGRVGYYRAKKGTPLDNKATSMARYQRRSHCKKRALKKGLALT